MIRNLSMWAEMFRADPLDALLQILLMTVALLICLISHEIGHGVVALWCGDPTAKMMGRLSPDPRKHLDPIGAVCMFFLGIGWAKPVPINPRNFKRYNRDMILVSFAGICVNLILFIVFSFLLVLTLKNSILPDAVIKSAEYSFASKLSYASAFSDRWYSYLQLFLWFLVCYNVSLAVFNLIPVPPLDGFRLVNQVFFRGNLYLAPQTMQIIHIGFMFVCISGLLSSAFSTVMDFFVNNVTLMYCMLLF